MKAGKKKSGGIQNNPRLKLRTNKDDESDNDESKALTDYQFIVNCLCEPNKALRPQEILEYIAITIKTYVGTHITVNMHQQTFIMHSKKGKKHLIRSMQTNDSDQNIKTSMQLSLPTNIKHLHDLNRIGIIIPIIYQKPGKNEQEEKKESTDYYTNAPRDVIAVLQERKTRLSSNDFGKGILFPYIINNESYEWYILSDLYITTIQKNYKLQRALIQNEITNDARRSHLEQTYLSYSYGKTKNVIKSIILCSKTMKVCVFTTTCGLFYTEHRLCSNYHDKNDSNNYEMNISVPLLYRTEYSWNQRGKNMFVDFWTQGNSDIYVWNYNNNIIYNVCFNIAVLHKYNDIDLSEMVKDMDKSQNMLFADDEDDNDQKSDDMAASEEEMNAKLRENGVLAVNAMYKIDTKLSIFAVRPQKDDCEIKAVYYESGIGEYVEAVYWIERNIKFGNWRFGGIAKQHLFKTSKQKSIQSGLRKREKRFYQTAPKGLTQEMFYIGFVDERDVSNKQFVIILKNHVVTIPLLKKCDVDNEHNTKPFAYCLSVKDVAPKLLLMNNEIKFDAINQWHYNYSNHTLYIFEKMAATGVYPYRMNEIAINAFTFD